MALSSAPRRTPGEMWVDFERRVRLAAVQSGGATALAHLIIEAHAGDRTAGGITVADLLDALTRGRVTDPRSVLAIVDVRECDRVRDLSAAQRVALVDTLYRIPVRTAE